MGRPVMCTVCFLTRSQYLALSIQSVDPAQADYEATRRLLERAAARRK